MYCIKVLGDTKNWSVETKLMSSVWVGRFVCFQKYWPNPSGTRLHTVVLWTDWTNSWKKNQTMSIVGVCKKIYQFTMHWWRCTKWFSCSLFYLHATLWQSQIFSHGLQWFKVGSYFHYFSACKAVESLAPCPSLFVRRIPIFGIFDKDVNFLENECFNKLTSEPC